MDESILNTIKGMLWGTECSDITEFDSELMVLINSSFSSLYQMGIGKTPFIITGSKETWDSVLTSDTYLYNVKRYIYIDAKLVFDPPSSSIVTETLKEIKAEDAWRITSEIDMKGETNE